MKAVLISIKPRWCELIASDKKTVEVRKTRPKLETPFKVYIYCTKGDSLNYLRVSSLKPKFWIDNEAYGSNVARANGKVIGEFVCDKIYDITPHFDKPDFCNQYICEWKYGASTVCLSFTEINEYLKGKKGYGWHISDLVIYDKPRELSEFKQVRAIRGYHKKDEPKTEGINIQRILHSSRVEVKYFTRPPQSWAYTESEAR